MLSWWPWTYKVHGVGAVCPKSKNYSLSPVLDLATVLRQESFRLSTAAFFLLLLENVHNTSWEQHGVVLLQENSGSSEEIPVNRLRKRANTSFHICASETSTIMPRAHTERETVCRMMIRDYFLVSITCHDQGYENGTQNTWHDSTVAAAMHCRYMSCFLPVIFDYGRTQSQQPLQKFHWEKWNFVPSPFGIIQTQARFDRAPGL